jgi:hypothetical protein
MNPNYRLSYNSLKEYFLSNAKQNYNKKQVELINILSNFLVNIVQDETCRKGENHLDNFLEHEGQYHGSQHGEYGYNLRDILCETTTAFVPVPLAESLSKKANLVVGKNPDRQGSYGEVFYMSVNKNPSVIKVPKVFEPDNIHEIFVNMFIINSLLMNNIFDSEYLGDFYEPFHFILCPTYGLFLCPTSGESSPMRSMCRRNKPTIFMIQERIIGETYGSFLENPKCDLTMEEFKYHIKKIFTAFVILQSSHFNLSHNDFHIENIMIKPKKPGNKYREVTILDFGMSSFSFAKENGRVLSFQPWIYDQYFGKTEVPIVTGAVDFFQFFFTFIHVTKNKSPTSELGKINKWCTTIANHFSSQFVDSRGNPIRSFLDYESLEHFFLLDILSHIERRAKPSMRTSIRARNCKTLLKLTYREICDLYFNEFMDYEVMEYLTIATYQPNVFPFISTKPLENENKTSKQNQVVTHQLQPQLQLKQILQIQKEQQIQVGINKKIVRSSKIKNKKAKKSRTSKNAKKVKSKESKDKCKCHTKIISGVNKGKMCNRPCKLGKKCGIHAKSK